MKKTKRILGLIVEDRSLVVCLLLRRKLLLKVFINLKGRLRVKWVERRLGKPITGAIGWPQSLNCLHSFRHQSPKWTNIRKPHTMSPQFLLAIFSLLSCSPLSRGLATSSSALRGSFKRDGFPSNELNFLSPI